MYTPHQPLHFGSLMHACFALAPPLSFLHLDGIIVLLGGPPWIVCAT